MATAVRKKQKVIRCKRSEAGKAARCQVFRRLIGGYRELLIVVGLLFIIYYPLLTIYVSQSLFDYPEVSYLVLITSSVV